ncbi:hypothetical protein BASA60_008685 [Batrachochytrium salamandrivorans]|nr:hypothetical protein BASA60_008685 [Batrachochytrium salamandrivorans]
MFFIAQIYAWPGPNSYIGPLGKLNDVHTHQNYRLQRQCLRAHQLAEYPLSEERDSPTKYIAYKTVLKCQAREWVVWRRYSEFDALNKQLSLLFPDAPPLPRQLPGKSFTLASSGLSFFTVDSAKMEARRIALEAYLQAILYSKYAQWRRSEVWLQFLGVSSTLRLPVTTLMDLNDDSNLAGCLAHIASRSSTGE